MAGQRRVRIPEWFEYALRGSHAKNTKLLLSRAQVDELVELLDATPEEPFVAVPRGDITLDPGKPKA